jgi:Domain of unknown function (DUF4150)/GHH signature containing HNH/Endo VII superfamily nuclease toxin  2
MSNEVYANTMEVSCKSAAGKSVAAFPDVCFTPPQTPATPPGVPVPYPNTGMASDCTEGSTTVKISGAEVMLKNKSYFKRSSGDEAGCAPQKGVITSTNMGKVYYNAWSMDVKVEGENVVRHLDMTTHNHASMPGSTPPWPYMDAQASPGITSKCEKDRTRERNACGYNKKKRAYTKSAEECCKDKDCQEARKCMLTPYGGKGSPNCCPPQVAHHLLPNSMLQEEGMRGQAGSNVPGLKNVGPNAYTEKNGPSVCCSGKPGVSKPIGTHKQMHDRTKRKMRAILMKGKHVDYETARSESCDAHNETFKDDKGKPLCSKECLEAQIDAHMTKTGTGGEIKVRQVDGATRKKFDKYKTGRTK